MFWETMKNVEKEELWMDGFKSGIFQFDSEEAKKGSSHKTHKCHRRSWNGIFNLTHILFKPIYMKLQWNRVKICYPIKSMKIM